MLLCIMAAVSTTTADEVVFHGTPPANARTLTRMARQAANTVDSVRTALEREGYLDARVTTDGNLLTISAGERFILDSTTVWSTDTVSLAANIPFTESNITARLDSILVSARSAGHYFASLNIARLIRCQNRVHLVINLNRGPRVTVSGTILRGLTRTDPEVTRRYFDIAPGDLLTDRLMQTAAADARTIRHLHFRPPIIVRPHPGYKTADLELSFEEQRPVSLEIGGGYVPKEESGLLWYIDLGFNNLFGGGRAARLFSERRERGNQILQVEYRQPLFLLGRGELALDIATRDYRDSFYEFAVNAAGSARLRRRLNAGLGLGYRTVEPATDLPSYSSYRAAFSIAWQVVDNPSNPASGLSSRWTIDYAYRRYREDSLAVTPERLTFYQTRLGVTLDMYQPLVGSFVGHLGLAYRGLETDETQPPVSELVLVGGPGTIRGYRNDRFAVLRTAIVTVEPRLRFNQGYLFGFYDGAYLNRRVPDGNGSAVTDERYRYGYGAGFVLSDNRRAIKLSLGWNPDLAFDQPRLSVEISSDL